jgi:hypothetical protein
MRETEKNNDALWSPDLERLKPILGNCWPDKWVRKVVGEYWQDGWYVNRNGAPSRRLDSFVSSVDPSCLVPEFVVETTRRKVDSYISAEERCNSC